MALPMTSFEGAMAVSNELMADGLEEAVFLDQEAVETAERARFDAVLGRLERSVEDRVLILRRRLTELAKRSRNALAERDRSLSVDARENAERTL
ncbi:MAG TPA: hypothetical protein VN603_12815, partial [Candidatus Acidoferrales bacterium]|nr:hypothetical protein [Candidatus Acidoferrales bacterium]